MIRAVLHYRASPGLTERLKAAESGWLSISVVDEADDESFVEAMQTADVLLHVLKPASIVLETIEVEEHGDTAIEEGRYKLSTADGQTADVGKYIVIWKNEGGTWKLH